MMNTQNKNMLTMKYHSAIIKDEVLVYVVIQMNLKNMVSERSQLRKTRYYDSIYMNGSE